MGAHIVNKVAFWIGMVVALALPLVPLIYRGFHPPRQPLARSGSPWDLLGGILDGVASVGESIAIMIWAMGLAAVAVIASLAALIAAWRAGESQKRKWLCGLPAVLAATIWGVMFLVY